jgi:hypothetical protein
MHSHTSISVSIQLLQFVAAPADAAAACLELNKFLIKQNHSFVARAD